MKTGKAMKAGGTKVMGASARKKAQKLQNEKKKGMQQVSRHRKRLKQRNKFRRHRQRKEGQKQRQSLKQRHQLQQRMQERIQEMTLKDLAEEQR